MGDICFFCFFCSFLGGQCNYLSAPSTLSSVHFEKFHVPIDNIRGAVCSPVEMSYGKS